MRTLSAAAAALAFGFAGQAAAAVSTTGCAAADACTLAELEAGGTLTVDGTTFDVSFLDDFGSIEADPSTITVQGSSSGGVVALDFLFDPAALVTGGVDFLGLDFDLDVDPGMGTITGVFLSFGENSASRSGEGFVGVDALLDDVDSTLLQIFDDFDFGTMLTDSADDLGLGLTTVMLAVGIEGFEEAFSGGIASFRLSFDGIGMAPIPVPAALPLFVFGLGGLAAARRQARRA